MQYTEQQLLELVKTVEKEFSAHLTKAEVLAKSEAVDSTAPLAKAEDEKPSEKPPEKKEEQKEAPAEEKKDGDKKEDAPPAEKKDESKPDEKPAADAKSDANPAAEQKPADSQAAPQSNEDGCDYDEQDMEHMHKMYGSMKKGELIAHHDSVKKALDAHMAKQQPGDMNMSKSENTETKPVEVKTETATQPNPEIEMLKTELEATKAEANKTKQTMEAVQAFLTKLVSVKAAPQGKAITSYEEIKKSEDMGAGEKSMNKNEIDATLLKKSQDPKLSKADRDAINNFYLAKADVNTISHLLK